MLLVVGIGLTLFQLAGASAVTTFLWIILCARRLHDLGRSGWIILIPTGLMLLVTFGAVTFGGDEFVKAVRSVENGGEVSDKDARLLFTLAGVVLVIQGGFTIWLGSKNGEPGSNRFGPPPGKLFG